MAQLLSLSDYIELNMLEFISKLFGNKSERDVKGIQPIVEKIKDRIFKAGRYQQ